MKEETNIDFISDLIVKEILDELSEIEKQSLRQWIEADNENRKLYKQLINSSDFKSWLNVHETIDVKHDWQKVANAIHKKRSRKINISIFKYAAVFFAIAALSAGIYYFGRDKKINPIIISETELIKPGSPKAFLILHNGQKIDLDTTVKQTIHEVNSTKINNTNGVLNYTKPILASGLMPVYNTIVIPRGGEYSLVLSDGTKIFLNAMSQLRFPVLFTGSYREIELTGEAYFEVAKDMDKPFRVKAKGLVVEVTGTSFNVNAYENSDKIITTLVEGGVVVKNSSNTGTQLLNPSEQAVFNLVTGETDVKKVDTGLFTAWKDGKLIFQDTRLVEVMEVLSRWYSFDTFYRDPGIKDIKTSGNLDRRADVREFLDIIESTGKINFEIDGKNIVISKVN